MYFNLMENQNIDDFLKESEEQRKKNLKKKEEHLKIIFSKLQLVGTGEKYDFLNVFQQNQGNKREENLRMIKEHTTQNILNRQQIENENRNSSNYQLLNNNDNPIGGRFLKDIVDKIIKSNNSTINFNQFELLGEFVYKPENGWKAFSDWILKQREQDKKNRGVESNRNQNN